ncbi:hypothetical protein J2Y38_002058 [Flavobacterium sp. 2755]|uniref:hypothetical protein n=1 Tax=Flavobacterium sp. 2755 TaxID=2817765 RepID=UPI0028551542|nr:hypothetical protein [Flavobacterium sp. 2755]MDR6761849.1 hypothetical protein [Flavobacterium sp. 2755]
MEENKLTKREEYIKEFNKRNWDDFRASHQRFDYLLVTFDGAGIYLSLELMKFLSENGKSIDVSLKVFGMCFAISIMFNFLTQFCSFNVFHNLAMMEQAIAFTDESKDEEIDLEKYNKKIKTYNFYSSLCMLISIILMIIGTIGLMTFMCIQF